MRVCWPRLTLYIVFIIIGVAGMLSGCGKKGPLYHPVETPQQAVTPVEPTSPPSH